MNNLFLLMKRKTLLHLALIADDGSGPDIGVMAPQLLVAWRESRCASGRSMTVKGTLTVGNRGTGQRTVWFVATDPSVQWYCEVLGVLLRGLGIHVVLLE